MQKIIDDLNELTTTSVSDALDGLNGLDPAIKPVKSNLRVGGKAYTVRVKAADNKLVLKGIREAEPGDVLIVDAKGYMNNASVGDFLVGLAKTMGLSGVVIDGVVRDIAGIRDLEFPVFCKGITTAASYRDGTGEVNVPVSCGNMVINPGDYIIGDENGVVCIPASQINEVISKAKEILVKDEERASEVLINREAAIKYIDQQFAKK